MEIEKLIRPDLQDLKAYSSARDEFQGDAEVYIDANENPFNTEINRYPDPLQRSLKQKVGEIKNVDPQSIFMGNGSDEVLDLIFRLFCIPAVDNVIITSPTYGMYKVLAGVNNVKVKDIHLNPEFQLDVEKILTAKNSNTKILFLCTPNNPVGNNLDRADVLELLDRFNGIVVIDEAYIDFSDQPSYSDLILEYNNLIVIQTFSKAWGMAGLRLGMGLTNPLIVSLLNKIKPPYNVNVLTQKLALEKLQNVDTFKKNLEVIKTETGKLASELEKLPMVYKLYSTAANFILVQFSDADKYYQLLLNKGIVVRNRSGQVGCFNCLRITVGTPSENKQLIDTLKKLA